MEQYGFLEIINTNKFKMLFLYYSGVAHSMIQKRTTGDVMFLCKKRRRQKKFCLLNPEFEMFSVTDVR